MSMKRPQRRLPNSHLERTTSVKINTRLNEEKIILDRQLVLFKLHIFMNFFDGSGPLMNFTA